MLYLITVAVTALGRPVCAAYFLSGRAIRDRLTPQRNDRNIFKGSPGDFRRRLVDNGTIEDTNSLSFSRFFI